MMMDDCAPIHERGKLFKIYRNVLPRERTMVAKVKYTPKLKGNAERERDRESERESIKI